MAEPFAITWSARAIPLVPAAVAARGPVALHLVERLRGLPDERLARLEGARANGLVVVAGPTLDLPWLDGVTYLGHEPDAADLLVPTTRQASAPAALVEAALRSRGALPAGPFAVLLEPLTLVPLGSLRRIDRAALGA